jgi:HAD superfamily hydrolase (TIGR01509 family)
MTPAADRVVFGGVIFDLDGVVADTEHLWEASWLEYSGVMGNSWTHSDSLRLQGLSVPEWSVKLAEHNGAIDDGAAAAAAAFCIGFIMDAIDAGQGDLMVGARELVDWARAYGPIALATSSARPIIDHLLAKHGLTQAFSATVSSAEVPKGKPGPDVYLEAARRVGLQGRPAIGIEDSSNGIRAAHAAGLYVIAIPNRQFPPVEDALSLADFVAVDHFAALTHLQMLLPLPVRHRRRSKAEREQSRNLKGM